MAEYFDVQICLRLPFLFLKDEAAKKFFDKFETNRKKNMTWHLQDKTIPSVTKLMLSLCAKTDKKGSNPSVLKYVSISIVSLVRYSRLLISAFWFISVVWLIWIDTYWVDCSHWLLINPRENWHKPNIPHTR